MKKETFIRTYFEQESAIELIAKRAGEIHQMVNQTYGGYLPYEFHLRLTASYVTRYAYLLSITENDIQTLYAAAYFHDTLEDARLTYHDLQKEFFQLNEKGCSILIDTAAESVYALTNEKGRNREVRANENYYKGIRKTKYASFLKMCDRLANIRYSTLFGIRQRMAEVYEKELPHFLESIGKIPVEMRQEAENLINEGFKRPSENIF